MKKIIAIILAFSMFFCGIDLSALQVQATESTETAIAEGEEIVEEVCEFVSSAETSAISMSMFSLDDGQVALKPSNEVKWIDRINLTDAECIRTFYDSLVEASDNDGINDYLIEDQYFSGAVGSDFKENNGNIYLIVDTVEGHVATKEEVSEVMNQVYQNYYFYIVAAGNAFDRDHPEVFWMTGSVAPGCLASRSGSESKGYDYTLYLTYLLKGNASGEAFDVRESNYQSQESIKNAIDTVNTKVRTLVNNVSDVNDEQKLKYFNEWLTKNNEYNRSSNLNAIGNECRECISALDGRTGTNGPVCEAYARAFKVLCAEADIPCVLVDGYAKNSISSAGEAHMWNYVQLNDSWYGVDVTWNDPLGGASGAASGFENDKWLLVGSDTIISSMKFIESHPVSNTASSNGISFTNGPVLESEKYVESLEPDNPELEEFALTYDILEDGTISINGYQGEMPKQLEIPENIEGYTVSQIGSNAFANCSDMETVSIPKTVTSIGAAAFFNCTGLKEIELSDTVTLIGENAFSQGIQDVSEYTNLDITIECTDKTYVHSWAVENGFDVSYGESYEVALNTNGGIISTGNITAYQKGLGAVLPNNITKTGYKFAGWYETEDFNGMEVKEIPAGSIGEKTFYAKWEWNVTFSMDIPEKNIKLIYNKEQQCWDFASVYLNIYSDTENIAPEIKHFTKEKDGKDSLVISIYKDENLVDPWMTVTNSDYFTVEETGDFTIKAVYIHPNGECTEFAEKFQVKYEEPETDEIVFTYEKLDDENIKITGYFGNGTNEIVIPETIAGYIVSEIGAYAFFNCDQLKNIRIPESVKTIGEYAFSRGNLETQIFENLDITIDVIKDSYAYTWANEHGYQLSYGDFNKIYLKTNGGTVISDNIIEYQTGLGAVLPTDVAKLGYTFAGWYEKSDYSGEKVTFIPAGSIGEKTFYAKWNLNIKFSLVPADTTVVIPYENGQWTFAKTHVFLETDPRGYTIDNNKATVTVTDPAGNSKKADKFNFEIDMPGIYTVVAEYRYGEEPADVAVTEAIKITAVYGKRPYPINEQISWKGISNLKTGLKFGDIIEEISDKLIADMQLNAEIGEILRDGNITIKNAKGKYVYNDTTNNAVTNGNYTVIYTLADYNDETEERFFETAEAELIVNYTEVSLGEFKYSLTEEEYGSGRTAGTTIAARILNESTGVYENGTSYGSAVVITPMFQFFEEQLTAPELRDKEYNVAFEITESGKSAGLEISEEENGGVIVAYNVESGVKVPSTTTLNVKAVITAGDKEVTLTKAIKNFKVVSGGTDVVESISVEILDERGNSLEAVREDGKTDVYLMSAKDMETAKVSYSLDVDVTNFAGEDYEGRLKDAKLKWTTSDKKLAEVKTDTNGNATLVINRGAVGTVDITVTANDAGKESYTFKLFILDTEMRVDSTKLTMNSYLEEPGVLKIYPNVASLEEAAKKLDEDWNVEISVLEGETFFDVDIDNYNKKTGELNVSFVDAEEANKTFTLKLLVRQYVGDFETEDELTFKITNKKAKPKLTLKAVSPYNIAYKNETGYAEMLINLTAPISGPEGDPAIYIDSEEFRLESLNKISDIQWSAKLSMDEAPELKVNRSKSFALEVAVEYEGYRVESTASVKVSATNQSPSMAVYGNEVYKATLYPQLALEETKILIALPEDMIQEGMYASAEDGTVTLGETTVSLTEKTAKNFEIVEGKFVSDATSVDSKGNVINVGDAVLVTVCSILGEKAKSANIQFVVENNEVFANEITTKTLKVYVEKITSLAMSMLDSKTRKKTTSVTFQKSFAGKEILTLIPNIPEQITKIYEMNGMNPSEHLILKVEAADKNATKVLGNNTLIVEENADGNVEIKTVAGVFSEGVSNCKMKFTVYATNDGLEKALKSVSFTVKLQTKETKVSAKTAVKGNLNVVTPDSSVTVTPTFGNLPVGAQVIGVEFANDSDAVLYKINDIQENGVATISKFADDTVLPIAKNTVPLVYKIQLMGGTTVMTEAATKINVTQTATVKADVKSVTLYNSVIGASYGKQVVFTETKAGAVIKDIVFTGLEKSGISTEQYTGENGEKIVNFYVDNTKDRGIKKTYNVKATVTLEGAGTKKGKEVTYTVSLKAALNN